jgi:hypothetical protein
MKEKTAYLECIRYMNNAKDTLKKSGKENGIYNDVKYVQMACGTAYSAVLIALDRYIQHKEGMNFKKPRSIEEYRTKLSKLNKKLLVLLNAAYDELHLAGYYHGTQSEITVRSGFDKATEIIEYLKAL